MEQDEIGDIAWTMEETIIREFSHGIHGTLRMRAGCPAFHPDAPQEILDFGPDFRSSTRFAGWRIICNPAFLIFVGGNQDREMSLFEEIFP